MSFLTERKIISKRLRLANYNQYVAEIFLLGLLAAGYLGWDDLAPVRLGTPIAEIERNAIALIAALGLYAIRLSSFIAMARNFRMPQRLEWLVFIIPTLAMVLCFMFSGSLIKVYATANGYRFCYRQHERATTYVFAHDRVQCPPMPASALPY